MKHVIFGPFGPPRAVDGLGPNIVQLPVVRQRLHRKDVADCIAQVVAFPVVPVQEIAPPEKVTIWDRLHGLVDRLEAASQERKARRLEGAKRRAVERARMQKAVPMQLPKRPLM